jgi:hypothetical protein
MAEALGLIQGGDQRCGGDAADAGHGGEALDARIVGGDVLDQVIGIGVLAGEGQHDGEERGDARAALTGRGHRGDSVDEPHRSGGRSSRARSRRTTSPSSPCLLKAGESGEVVSEMRVEIPVDLVECAVAIGGGRLGLVHLFAGVGGGRALPAP